MEFDIKKGHYAHLEGEGLKNLMTEVLGPVREESDVLVTAFGATTRFEVRLVGKTALSVTTESDKGASTEAMMESNRKYNDFMERATGFSTKERSKRLQAKAKKGKL